MIGWHHSKDLYKCIVGTNEPNDAGHALGHIRIIGQTINDPSLSTRSLYQHLAAYKLSSAGRPDRPYTLENMLGPERLSFLKKHALYGKCVDNL